MRKSQPLRWIEEAEARQVVTLALSETPPLPDASHPPPPPISWIARIRRWGSAAPAIVIVIDETAPDAVAKPLRR